MKLSKRRQVENIPEVSVPQVVGLSFDKALVAFLDGQKAANHSDETYSDYRSVVGIFIRYISEKHQYTVVQDITEADILSWLAYLHDAINIKGVRYSSRSIQTYHRNVSTFFNWLFDHKYITFNPMSQVKIPKTEKALIRVFTEDELERLDAACNRAVSGRSVTPDERKTLAARDRAILWLLLSTGIRLSEVCGLRFSDLDWDKGMIYVMGKGSKERRVPIGSVARQHLNTYIVYWRGTPSDFGESVFMNVFGKPIAPSTVKQIFARLKRLAGIADKRVSAHTCRHWFAVNCIKNGMPSTVLQGLLGHEQLEMINTYVRLAEQDNKDLYTKHSPVDRLPLHQASGGKGKREVLRDWRNSRKKTK